MSLGRAFSHRLSAATGLWLGAAILLGGYQMYGAYRNPADRGQPGGEVLASAAVAVPVVALILGVLAAVAVIGTLHVAILSRRYLVALVVLLGFAVGIAAVALWAGIIILLAGLPALVTLVVLAIVLTGPANGSPPSSRRARVVAAVGFPLAALALCAVGIAHVFVWNPLAAVPGMTLDQIYAGLAAAGEATGAGIWGAVWAVLTMLAAVGYLVFAVARSRRRPAPTGRRLVTLGSLLVAGTVVLGFLPAFGMGMGIADAFMTTGGDFAVTGPLLAIAGQAALVVAVLATFIRPAPLPQEQAAVP